MFIEFNLKLKTQQNMEALICINFKMTFTLTVVVNRKGSEIEFRGLFWLREVFLSRTVAHKII
jgi:hypothetical protein